MRRSTFAAFAAVQIGGDRLNVPGPVHDANDQERIAAFTKYEHVLPHDYAKMS